MRSLGVFFLLVLVSRTSNAEILYIRDGLDCRTLDGGYGNCVLLTSCENPGNFRVRHPPICSFKGKEPVICCPKSPAMNRLQRPPGILANEYCGLLQLSHPGCLSPPGPSLDFDETMVETEFVMVGDIRSNFKQSRSDSNGVEYKPRLRNYMVLIGYGPQENIKYKCAGSLIAPKYILSAARCSDIFLLGPAKWARLGDLDVASLSDDSAIQDREIVDRIVYPEYNNTQVYHDIALFRMDREVDYNPWVTPVCLYTEPALPETRGTVSGWGRTEFAGEKNDHLLETELDILSDTLCRQLHPFENYRSPRGIDSETMLCAEKIGGSKENCPAEAGVPLVVSKEPGHCLRSLVGIFSYDEVCGAPKIPGVYTKVYFYLSWIESIVFQELGAVSVQSTTIRQQAKSRW